MLDQSRPALTTPCREHVVARPGGRVTVVRDTGPPDGRPALYLHGFLGSRLECAPADEAARTRGLRLVSFDRPGFGRTSAAPPGAVHDADDAVAVCTALGLRRPIVIGVSGGAATALLAAARIRAPVVVLACPLGPLDEAAMRRRFSRLARFAFSTAARRPQAARWLLDGPFAMVARQRPTAVLAMLRTRVTRADREALAHADWHDAIARSLAESFATGADGALRDLLAYPAPWDTAAWRIDVPVRLWHGTRDTVVPLECARTLARQLPAAMLRECLDEGHLSVPLRRMGAMLDEAVQLADASLGH